MSFQDIRSMTQEMLGEWLKENGQYIPHQSTWLNGGYWDNETEVATNGSNAPDEYDEWFKKFAE